LKGLDGKGVGMRMMGWDGLRLRLSEKVIGLVEVPLSRCKGPIPIGGDLRDLVIAVSSPPIHGNFVKKLVRLHEKAHPFTLQRLQWR
jgi:hypothetical protein